MSFYFNTLTDIREKLKNTGFKSDYPEIDDYIKTNDEYYKENPADFIRRTQKKIVGQGTGETYIGYLPDSEIQRQINVAQKKTSYLEFIIKSIWSSINKVITNGEFDFNTRVFLVVVIFVYILMNLK